MWSYTEFCFGLRSFRPQVRRSLSRALLALGSHPGTSYSRSLGEGFRQSISRILSDQRMTSEIMLEGHIQSTLQRCKDSDSKRIIVAQDTTSYSYSPSREMAGLGHIQGNIQGFLQHNAFCLDDQGLPLGLIHQYHWTRGGKNDLEKESQKWFDGLDAVNQRLGQIDKSVVLVQDRESDIFDFFKADRADNVDIVCRVFQPRKISRTTSDQHQMIAKLKQTAQQLPLLGQHQLSIRRANKEQRITLSVQADQVDILPRKDLSDKLHKTQGLSLVVATEVGAVDSKGKDCFEPEKASQWLLITSMKALQIEQAIEVIHCYAKRWTVERLHYTLKSGALKVENLQFDDIETTFNAFAMYSILAWRIMYLSHLARSQPEKSPKAYFSTLELKILKTVDKNAEQSVHIAIRALGKLVNWVPTRKQPYPGIKILTIALGKLKTMSQAVELFLQDPKLLQD